MTHYTAQERINGNWRNTLIIVTDTPSDFPAEIRFDEETGAGVITTIYPVDEALEVKESDGRYYYWFAYNESYTLYDGESSELSEVRAELAEADAALNIAIGGATNEQD